MKLGQLIVESKSLPVSDPFSFTFASSAAHPFVIYQWLSEVTFYEVFRLAGLVGLSMFAAAVLALSFVVIPMRMVPQTASNVGTAIAWSLVVLGTLAASFHFYVRPELFSYLLLGVLLLASRGIRNQAAGKSQFSNFCAPLIVCMFALWCNLHSGFVVGLLYLASGVVVSVLSGRRQQRGRRCIQMGLLLGTTILLTLANPYGYRLWMYLSQLFFTPTNNFVNELKPITWSATFLPFIAMALLSSAVSLEFLRRSCIKKATLSFDSAFSLLVIAIAIWVSVMHRRMIDFGVLLITNETCLLLTLLYGSQADKSNWKVVEIVGRYFAARRLEWQVTVCSLAMCGAYFCSMFLTQPSLPHSCSDFEVPSSAVEFIRKNPIKGRLFAHTLFADTLIWNLPKAPLVFLDTRFDMYSGELYLDYRRIRDCEAGWQSLLDRYEIDSVFVPPHVSIAYQLLTNDQWMVVYRDNCSILFTRKSTVHPENGRSG